MTRPDPRGRTGEFSEEWSTPSASGPSARAGAPAGARKSPRDAPAMPPAVARQALNARLAAQAAAKFMASFQVLLRAVRLYQSGHPQLNASLESAEAALREALETACPLAVRFERGSLALDSGAGHAKLPDPRGNLKSLAEEMASRGIVSLVFDRSANLGELHSLVTLLESLGREDASHLADSEWPHILERHHIGGLRVNAPAVEQRAGAALAGLISAVLHVDLSGWKAEEADAGAPPYARTPEEAEQVVSLLGRISAAMREAPEGAGDEARSRAATASAEALKKIFQESTRRALTILVACFQKQAPQAAERLEPYLSRMTESLLLDSLLEAQREGRARVTEVRALAERLARSVAAAGALYPGALPTTVASPMRILPGGAQWTDESFAEYLHHRFWEELPAGQRSEVLRGREAWCVPAAPLRQSLERLMDAGGEREARHILLNFAQCLGARPLAARRNVADGLSGCVALSEKLWPGFLPEDLSRAVMRAMAEETAPDVAAVLAGVADSLAQLALRKHDFAEFERILAALEAMPDSASILAGNLRQRLMGEDIWNGLMLLALDNRPLDPALPRILGRDPGRVLDCLTAQLATPRGLESLPAMARLVKAIGEPAIGTLVTQVFDPRTPQAHFAGSAVKLLSATRPERLVEVLPRALPDWDWNVQDLAAAELVRSRPAGLAQAFLAVLGQAHPLVVPIMIDEISVSRETAAVPYLVEIAGGQEPRLKDVYVRIKAVEALGRMRVPAAADTLRAILRRRDGLIHTEPAGLRAAAEDALGMIENRPSSQRVRAVSDATQRASQSFTRPRRYLRIPLQPPLAARVMPTGAAATHHSEPANMSVETISLGGAFLRSNRRLQVGDALNVQIKAGLRSIESMAVVRNVSINGGGVEFVHMKQEDREKLRRLISKLIRD